MEAFETLMSEAEGDLKDENWEEVIWVVSWRLPKPQEVDAELL